MSLAFDWRTFSRQVTARWWRQSAKNQVSTNQNSRNRWCLIVRRTIYTVPLTIRHHLFLEFWLVDTWFFCWLTSPPCCNAPRKCMPFKSARYMKRQKAGSSIVRETLCHEETRKHACKTLQSQSAGKLHKINKLSKPRNHQGLNTKSKEIIKKCKKMSILQWLPPQRKMSCLDCNWKNYFRVCWPQNWKKVHKIEQTKADCKDSSDLEFFVETISIQDPLNINGIKSESSVWSITLIFNRLPFLHKTDTGTKCNVVLLKIHQKINPQPDLHPENLKLSAYNTSEIPVIDKCHLL